MKVSISSLLPRVIWQVLTKVARTIDFDIARSILVPLYASPDYNGSALEIILKANNEMHSLKFGARAELYKFQQALTGYEVVDQHME